MKSLNEIREMNITKRVVENEIETIWSSEEVNHNGDPFFTIKKARGYYLYAQRVGVDSIAFILYDGDTQKYALIHESKPPLDTTHYRSSLITAFGGSIDMGKETSYQEICQIEVVEESGYIVPFSNIHSIGKTLVSTQMSQLCEGFIVDVTNLKKEQQAEWELYESSSIEGERVIWMSADEVMENGDWKSVYIMTQARYREII